jgi:hypothetical protein
VFSAPAVEKPRYYFHSNVALFFLVDGRSPTNQAVGWSTTRKSTPTATEKTFLTVGESDA